MPLDYHIDEGLGIVTITGDYADADAWRALLTRVLHDPAFRPRLSFLRDLRGSRHPVTPEIVVGIIAVVREFWDVLQARRAAIVTRPTLDAPAMIAHALADDEHIPLRAFTSYDDAVAWFAAAEPPPS